MMPYRRMLAVLTAPVGIFTVWYIVTASRLVSPTLLPTPADTLFKLWELVSSGSVIPDISATMLRMFVGYGAAAIVGAALGLAMGSWRFVFDTCSWVVDFIRSVPITSLYPVFVLLCGIGHLSKIAMVFSASVFIVALHSAYGVSRSNRVRQQMAQLYGANRKQVFLWVTVFDALPQTMIGLRIALSYSLIVEILCEMFMGSTHGIGQRIIEAYTVFASSTLFALVLITGLIGYGLNRLFVAIERRLVPWGER